MQLLVAGGQGFIGSNFIRYVLSAHEDLRITNIDKMGIGSAPNSLEALRESDHYRFIHGDIGDHHLVSKIVQDVDAVVNFAAETHVDRSIADPLPFMHSNVQGVLTLLESIRKLNRGAKFIQISTDEVYGDIMAGSFTEKDRLKPSNPYSATKAAADMLVLAYRRTYDQRVTIARPTNNFGPFQFPEKLLPKAIIRALRGLPIPIYGTGQNIRDWMYVLDHCRAIDLILQKGGDGEIYNISAGNELPNIEVIRRLLEIMGKPEELMTYVDDRPGHDARYSLDSSKLRTQLGWSPRVNFLEALRKTIDWYVDNESWWTQLATEDVLRPIPWKTS